MEIKSLAESGFDAIFKAFNQAFADYEVRLDKTQLQDMFKRRGFKPDLSFAAFDKDEIVAFTCNGIGNFEGIATAYDTGTGTLKDYRGKGLASKIFEYAIPYLREANIRQYLLEVLQHNTPAVSVYRNLGFEVTREFYYFTQENKEIRNKLKAPDSRYSIQPVDIEEFRLIQDFRDFYPSWQNSFDSIKRASGGFVNMGVFSDRKLIGYCVFEPVSGDITQIAVDKNYRRRGIASLLLQEMIKLNKCDSVKVINTDIRCDSITHFLQAKNIAIRGKQFEMIRKI